MIERFLFTHTPLVYLVQSLWRDEAFSIEVANHPVIEILAFTAREYNAPLYYIFLHYWIVFFGSSEITIRLLSLVPHVLLGITVYWFTSKAFSKVQARIMTLSVLLNPMLVNYIFEARGYSWFALFATLSMVTFLTRRWKIYILATASGLYTHAYMLFIPVIELMYCGYLYLQDRDRRQPVKPFLRALSIVIALYGVWIPILLRQWWASKESWIYPVDWQLTFSVLGNLFTSYEGTPGGWWVWTRFLSLGLLVLFYLAVKKKQKFSGFLFLWIIVPTSLILAVSLVKPLYVNRYLIFVTVAESLLSTLGLISIPGLVVRRTMIIGYFALLIGINSVLASYPRRLDSRAVFQRLAQAEDTRTQVYVDVLLYFDALYYYPYRENIHVYSPPGSQIPNYVGLVLIPDEVIVDRFSEGERTIVVDAAGNMREEVMK